MRILSWNINGVRTLPQYHPWNSFKTFEGILEYLEANIICFQEMKTSRTALVRDVAVPDHFDSFFSFPASKGGYSGVAVYTDTRTVTPLKAEEGLSGTLQPKPPFQPEERISCSYPYAHEMDLMPSVEGEDDAPSNLSVLDAEGRGLVIDLGLFVLINVYCPNETSDSRLPYKMNYHFMLQERVRKLVAEGREVMVVGDINVCAAPIDHCDGHLPSNAETFYDHPARSWFQRWRHPQGDMVDVLRHFWPERKGMYTCWNTKISARETNYGTRIDYVLVTRGLMPWIKHGDIQASVKGSDHCPIYVDLYDEITTESGDTLYLKDVMPADGNAQRVPPRIAAKRWDEFSGKQQLLSSFFGKKGKVSTTPQAASPKSTVVMVPPATKTRQSSGTPTASQSTTDTAEPPSSIPEPTDVNAQPSKSSPSPIPQPVNIPKEPSSQPSSTAGQKRKLPSAQSTAAKSTKKPRPGQSTIASFFTQPQPPSFSPPDTASLPQDFDLSPNHAAVATAATDPDLDADYQLALKLSQELEADAASQMSSSTNSSKVWANLMAPVAAPNCTVHNEPTKLYTVNKQGPNKGKTFYLCSRPVGPGYDRGRSERLREEVNHEYRCNYFKWASDVKRESLAKPKGSSSS